MAYQYKYILPDLNIRAGKPTDPKSGYIDLFQETLNNQFYNASNWWTISEEATNGSEIFEDVDVRITHVINSETGLKLGDDWKALLFKDVSHSTQLGKLYIFDSNTWLTINTELVKNLTGTCTVRRCNNTMRWIDEATGIFYQEPCCIEYLVKEPRDYLTSGSPFATPGGFLHIEMQLNERTNLIRENQRFLFGNPGHWTCYKVIGTGLGDFKNQVTYDNNSAQILSVDLIANFVNDELDDITNGIADVNTNLYTITLNKSTVAGIPTNTIQLIPTITYNGKTVSRTVTWATSNALKATVTTGGLVTLVANGTCNITATIDGNPATASCAITISATPVLNSDIRISPDTNYVLEGANRTYAVYLYENDSIQADTFTITCNGHTVPTANYTFSQTDANHFKITNILRDSSSYLTITCTVTGIGGISETFNIFLRGGW